MIRYLMGILLPGVAFAATPPSPMPIFLKAGFSTVLDFPESPTRVILGDSQSFQVERTDRSLVIRTLTPYATGNLFVYFKKDPPRLFILTASEDANPTFYKKFDPPETLNPPQTCSLRPKRAATPKKSRVVSAHFDDKKDYLTLDAVIHAGSDALLIPEWDRVRLRFSARTLQPHQAWAERKEVQRDSEIKARFVFRKPNLPRDLKDASLIIPLLGNAEPLILKLEGVQR